LPTLAKSWQLFQALAGRFVAGNRSDQAAEDDDRICAGAASGFSLHGVTWYLNELQWFEDRSMMTGVQLSCHATS